MGPRGCGQRGAAGVHSANAPVGGPCGRLGRLSDPARLQSHAALGSLPRGPSRSACEGAKGSACWLTPDPEGCGDTGQEESPGNTCPGGKAFSQPTQTLPAAGALSLAPGGGRSLSRGTCRTTQSLAWIRGLRGLPSTEHLRFSHGAQALSPQLPPSSGNPAEGPLPALLFTPPGPRHHPPVAGFCQVPLTASLASRTRLPTELPTCPCCEDWHSPNGADPDFRTLMKSPRPPQLLRDVCPPPQATLPVRTCFLTSNPSKGPPPHSSQGAMGTGLGVGMGGTVRLLLSSGWWEDLASRHCSLGRCPPRPAPLPGDPPGLGGGWASP